MKAVIKNETTILLDKSKKPEPKKTTFFEGFIDNNEGFGYCCEFIMELGTKVSLKQDDKDDFNLEKFKEELNDIGDSLVAVVDDNIVKVHVHSLTPNKVLEIGTQYGEFHKVKIENMTLQFLERNPGTTLEQLSKRFNANQQKVVLSSEPKVIATVPSGTIQKLYKNELKIDLTINSEVKGNPSIQEFLDQIKQSNSSKLIIVVDDANTILAANEAIQLIPKNERTISLIPANNIGASYLACLAFNPIESYEDNVKNMARVASRVVVGKISKSSKSIKYSHIEVKKDDFIGIIRKKIVSDGKQTTKVAGKLIKELFKENKKAKTAYIIYGKDALMRDVRDIEKIINETLSLKTVIIQGNQPIYSYYIVLE